MSRILVVGNTGLDILYRVPRLPGPHEKLPTDGLVVSGGGSPANTAHWLARLGHEVHFATVVGQDPLSRFALDCLAGAGVDVSLSTSDPEGGLSVASIFSIGADKSMICGGQPASGRLWHDLIERIDFSRFEHVHVSPAVFRLLFAQGRPNELSGRSVSTDMNGTYDPEMVSGLDLCFTNHDELARATDNAPVEDLLARDGVERSYHLVVTRAGTSVTSYRPDAVVRVAPRPADIQDRSGGGDAFCAGFLHGYLRETSDETAIETGLAMARAAFSGPGCRPETPLVQRTLSRLSVSGA
ncbi:carbohydrate kinase family protein [Roseibium aggregatum]|uniref:Carbohydrate kinase family protein n=1 Tax=Roseibium aggregatum TaxID=187304 RepID=A0A939J4Z1_9HYPH|nr:carbohydrate kinase family protein [Roseibium aggregatum]MBN9674083.1 carbohydrate kinase family protein [Roseibium aggregatum]